MRMILRSRASAFARSTKIKALALIAATRSNAARFDRDNLKAEAAIGLCVDPFKTERFLEADPPSFGRCDEAKIPNKEDAPLKDRLRLNPLQFAGEYVRGGMPEILSKYSGADGGAVVELYPIRLTRRAKQPPSLQISKRADERGKRPWFRDSLRLRECNDVSRSLFDDAETVKLELTEYRCFSRARGPGQYETLH
jgi:hypothetical protein